MAIDKVRLIKIIDLMHHIQYYTMHFDLGVTMFIILNGIGEIFAFVASITSPFVGDGSCTGPLVGVDK